MNNSSFYTDILANAGSSAGPSTYERAPSAPCDYDTATLHRAGWTTLLADVGDAELASDVLATSELAAAPDGGIWKSSIQELCSAPSDSNISQLLRSTIYMSSNNHLTEADARLAVSWFVQDKNISLLETLLSGHLPTMRALAKALLREGIKYSDVEIVRLLLGTGVDPDLPLGPSRERPIFVAVKTGDRSVVQLLLHSGAEVNAPPADHNGRTALQAAAKQGNTELVQVLLNFGADVNAPPAEDDGRTALQAAAQQGNLELVRLLLDCHADVNGPPSATRGITALQGAAIIGVMSVVRVLLEKGADVNAASSRYQGRTAVEGAAEHGRLDIVQLLLNVGGDVEDSRAQEFARSEGHDGVVALLEQRCSRIGTR
jgi:ankyrin repeat protein